MKQSKNIKRFWKFKGKLYGTDPKLQPILGGKPTRLMLATLALITLAGCTIPVVGNSPEEVKHRKQLQEP